MVAIAAHPDTGAEGAEGEAVVAAAMLLEELLVVDLGVLVLIGAVVAREQGRSEDGLVEDPRHVAVVVGADAVSVQLVHGVEIVAVLHLLAVAHGTKVFGDALVGGVVVVVAHHDDLGVGVVGQQRVGDVSAQGGGGHTARQGALLTTVA